MKRFKFEKTIKAAGRLFTAGAVVPAADIPADCLGSLLRLRRVSEVPAAAPKPVPSPEPKLELKPEPEPKPAPAKAEPKPKK